MGCPVTRLDDLFADFPTHLTVEELAQVLGVAAPTAYKWLQQGNVPGYKVGRSWVVVRDEVKDFLAAQRNRPLTDSYAADRIHDPSESGGGGPQSSGRPGRQEPEG